MAFPNIPVGILVPSIQFAMDAMTDLGLEFANIENQTGNQSIQKILAVRNNPAEGVFPLPPQAVIQAARNILTWAYTQIPLPQFFAGVNDQNNNLGDNYAQQIHALIAQHLPPPPPPPPPVPLFPQPNLNDNLNQASGGIIPMTGRPRKLC